jgi:hypothetical protein
MLPTLDSPAQVESRLWRSSNVYFVSVIPREGLAHDSLRRFEALRPSTSCSALLPNPLSSSSFATSNDDFRLAWGEHLGRKQQLVGDTTVDRAVGGKHVIECS